MAKRTCLVDGCETLPRTAGRCQRHHTLHVGGRGRSRKPETVRTCSVDGCESKHYGLGYCARHWSRFKTYGRPDDDLRYSAMRGEASRFWTGDDVSYTAAHLRVGKRRGPASKFPCVECGGPATDWAYDHQDPNERRDPDGLRPRSALLEHYQPMCRPCHRTFDHRMEAATWGDRQSSPPPTDRMAQGKPFG